MALTLAIVKPLLPHMNKLSSRIIFSLILFFSLFTIVLSFYYSNKTGGTDLRNRIVGTRLMKKGYSPYFYKWRPADGEILLDTNGQPNRLDNSNTVTPATFYVNYLLSFLSYPHIRTIWTILLLICAAAVVWIMLKSYEGSSPLFSAAIVVLGLLSSDYWFHMLEKGELTIF